MQLYPLLLIYLLVQTTYDTFDNMGGVCKILNVEEETICTTQIVDSALEVGYEKMMKLELNASKMAYIQESLYYDLVDDDEIPCWYNSEGLVKFGTRESYYIGLALWVVFDTILCCAYGLAYTEVMFVSAIAKGLYEQNLFPLSFIFVGVAVSSYWFALVPKTENRALGILCGCAAVIIGIVTHQP